MAEVQTIDGRLMADLLSPAALATLLAPETVSLHERLERLLREQRARDGDGSLVLPQDGSTP